MEMSSPLAAMHPPPVPAPWGYRRDLAGSKLFAGGIGSKNLNFNFRDLSMKKGHPDYFGLSKPPQGSSPTASLAADMSSNLHVDQSPQFSTPRRSLFTSVNFQKLEQRAAEGTTTPPVAWEGVTTPDVPSSSPCFMGDSMDISPLPHKVPYSYIAEQPLPSPSPVDEDMVSPCELPTPPQFPASQSEDSKLAPTAERKKTLIPRPSLTRAKNYSTNTVSFKAKENNAVPTFKFGAGVDTFASTSAPSLDECFAASPQDRRSWPANLVGPRARPFSLNTNVARCNGSPLSANVRKPVGPPGRPRSKFRRSLSMFESPGDVMNQEEAEYTPSGLQSVMDIDDSPDLKLPNFTPPNEPDSLPRISDGTLISVLNGDFDHLFDKTVVIDCRFEYEYEGGHIEGARNFCEKEQLLQTLFQEEVTPNTLLIFHCEYSAHRAPLMAKLVRHEDRRVNAYRYPQLSYPEMYILDGGYSAFFESHRTRCQPQNYLRMDDKDHENACERGMNKLRQRSKLSRAQTFAFGTQSCQMEDSPTACARSKGGNATMLCNDDSPNVGRMGVARRMASY